MPQWYIEKEERYAHVQRYLTFYQLFAGAASGAVTKTAVAPLERVKILLQLSGMSESIRALPTDRSLWKVMRQIVREEGALALFKGNFANVIRVVPVYALKFAFNDRFRDVVRSPGQLNRDLSTRQLMAAGTMAGLAQIVITYPLEVVRTRLSLSTLSLEGQYNGIVDCIVKTVRSEGVSALYKGLSATMWSGAPYVGLQMTSYELVKRYLLNFPSWFSVETPLDAHDHSHVLTRSHQSTTSSSSSSTSSSSPSNNSNSNSSNPSPPSINMLGKLTAGGLSGLISQTITYPGDTLRRRMQTNGLNGKKRLYTNTWDCCVKIWKNEGMIGYFRGASTNVWRCIPGAAIQFAVYDSLKHLLGIAVE